MPHWAASLQPCTPSSIWKEVNKQMPPVSSLHLGLVLPRSRRRFFHLPSFKPRREPPQAAAGAPGVDPSRLIIIPDQTPSRAESLGERSVTLVFLLPFPSPSCFFTSRKEQRRTSAHTPGRKKKNKIPSCVPSSSVRKLCHASETQRRRKWRSSWRTGWCSRTWQTWQLLGPTRCWHPERRLSLLGLWSLTFSEFLRSTPIVDWPQQLC